MPACKCHRCGEDITAIYWHEGKPYGYSCIRYVNPTAKKSRVKEHWLVADSHTVDINRNEKQQCSAKLNGKTYSVWVFKDHNGNMPSTIDRQTFILDKTGHLFINIAAFKGYEKSKP